MQEIHDDVHVMFSFLSNGNGFINHEDFLTHMTRQLGKATEKEIVIMTLKENNSRFGNQRIFSSLKFLDFWLIWRLVPYFGKLPRIVWP